MLLQVIKKHRGIILAIFLVSVLGTALLNAFTAPVYEAEAKLRLKLPKPLANSLLQEDPVSSSADLKERFATYSELFRSRIVIDSARQKLPYPVSYKQMLKGIIVQPIKDTEILRVAVQADTPDKAKEMTNALVVGFTERLNQLAVGEQRTVREFIETRLHDANAELKQAEEELADYKQAQGIYASTEERKAMIEQLYANHKMAHDIQVNLSASEARLLSAKQQLSVEAPGVLADNVVIQNYKTKLLGLEADLAAMQKIYSGDHPKVIALQAEIHTLQKNLASEVNKVINSEAPSQNPIHQELEQNLIQAEAERAAAIAQKKAIADVIAGNEENLRQLPHKEEEVARLNRNVLVAQDTYMMLAKRYEEARISEAMQLAEVQLVEPAVLPEEPIQPRRLLNLILGAIFGLCFGLTVAALLESRCKPHKSDEKINESHLPVITIRVYGCQPFVVTKREKEAGVQFIACPENL